MTDVAPLDVDGEAAHLLDGARWTAVTSGANTLVWRCTFGDGRAPVVVKAARSGMGERADEASAQAVRGEADRLGWLAAHVELSSLRLPEVVLAPAPDDPAPLLITRWIDAEADLRLLGSAVTVARIYGQALAEIHGALGAADLDVCPFDASLTERLTRLEHRVADGLVDPTRFGEPFDRYTPAELLVRINRMAEVARDPEPADRVLLHGDLCVTNLLVDVPAESPVAAVDWAWAGVGDRHQDLAITARSLLRNFGGESLPTFFAAYGGFDPDPLRIELYSISEELF